MVEGLRGLKELALVGCHYGDTGEILQIIARDLTTLESLGFIFRCFSIDFKALEYHPSLKSEAFNHSRGCSRPFPDLYEHSQEILDSVSKLFNTLMTLPKLEEVKGLGCIHKRNDYLKHILAAKPHI